jgi:iron complex transport system ATP-binding protein
MDALAFDRVSVELGGRAVLADVSASFAGGEWAVVIGPNGAGKTTFLRAACGLVSHEGAVSVFGRSLASFGRRELARTVAVVPQSPSIPQWMTVFEYVLLGRTPYIGLLARESCVDIDAVAAALERLDLNGHAARLLGTLSGGELQRVIVARTLVQDAPLVLLDEPTSALDIGHQQQTLELLDTLRRDAGLTLVGAMHDLTLAAQFADRMILLDGGRVVVDGRPEDVLTEERLAEHYDADVSVLDLDGRLAVVPRRAAR